MRKTERQQEKQKALRASAPNLLERLEAPSTEGSLNTVGQRYTALMNEGQRRLDQMKSILFSAGLNGIVKGNAEAVQAAEEQLRFNTRNASVLEMLSRGDNLFVGEVTHISDSTPSRFTASELPNMPTEQFVQEVALATQESNRLVAQALLIVDAVVNQEMVTFLVQQSGVPHHALNELGRINPLVAGALGLMRKDPFAAVAESSVKIGGVQDHSRRLIDSGSGKIVHGVHAEIVSGEIGEEVGKIEHAAKKLGLLLDSEHITNTAQAERVIFAMWNLKQSLLPSLSEDLPTDKVAGALQALEPKALEAQRAFVVDTVTELYEAWKGNDADVLDDVAIALVQIGIPFDEATQKVSDVTETLSLNDLVRFESALVNSLGISGKRENEDAANAYHEELTRMSDEQIREYVASRAEHLLWLEENALQLMQDLPPRTPNPRAFSDDVYVPGLAARLDAEITAAMHHIVGRKSITLTDWYTLREAANKARAHEMFAQLKELYFSEPSSVEVRAVYPPRTVSPAVLAEFLVYAVSMGALDESDVTNELLDTLSAPPIAEKRTDKGVNMTISLLPNNGNGSEAMYRTALELAYHAIRYGNDPLSPADSHGLNPLRMLDSMEFPSDKVREMMYAQLELLGIGAKGAQPSAESMYELGNRVAAEASAENAVRLGEAEARSAFYGQSTAIVRRTLLGALLGFEEAAPISLNGHSPEDQKNKKARSVVLPTATNGDKLSPFAAVNAGAFAASRR